MTAQGCACGFAHRTAGHAHAARQSMAGRDQLAACLAPKLRMPLLYEASSRVQERSHRELICSCVCVLLHMYTHTYAPGLGRAPSQ